MTWQTTRLGILTALGVSGALSGSACNSRPIASQPEPNSGADAGTICTECGQCAEHFAVVSAFHTTEPVDYLQTPPVGGDHDPCWADWTEFPDLPPENWVHNMEHGGVILLYNCPDGCDDELAAMRNFLTTHERTILTQYPDMDAPFAVVAWGHRLVSACWDDAAAEVFYEEYFGQGPEDVPAGAPPQCHEQ